MSKIDAILVAGPTASGKSAFAMKLAEKHEGVIVNADSMQIYLELRILTARPSLEDEAKVPHAMYGTVSGKNAYSVGQWYSDAKDMMALCKKTGKVPIFTGGTGLYFHALLNGLSPVPEIPENIRAYWRKKAEEIPIAELYEVLGEKDSVMAERLMPTDTQRITRALEVIEATGVSLSEWQQKKGIPLLADDQVEKYVIAPEREQLYERCNKRFDIMMDMGAMDEVKYLMAQEFDESLPIIGALGFKPLRDFLLGYNSLEDALEVSKRDTRRYAKRQMTWLKSNMITWKWVKK